MRTKEKVQNEVKLSFTAVSQNEAFARFAVTSLLAPLNPTVEELADLRTAVSEAVTNAIIHGYRGKTGGTVRLHIKLLEDRRVVIRVSDDGVGIPDIEQAMQPLYTTDPEGERGGMGFAIMKSFTDRLSVRSVPGKGTVVTMTRKLSEAACA